MSLLSPLMDIQELDLAADKARVRSERLPERETLPVLTTELATIDQSLRAAESELSEMRAEEERLGGVVSQVVRDIEAAEIERYSGKRLNRDDANSHDEAQQRLRAQKDALEEQEMDILEKLEAVEGRLEEGQGTRSARQTERARVQEAIQKVEAETETELEHLEARRAELTPSIPPAVLAAYDRVRSQPRAGGRGAALITKAGCSACQIRLPSHEKVKMLAEPEDALIQCPQCRRVLIR
jgi:hypothetical protein